MKTTAAILVAPGRPLELADLEIPPLKSGQLLVEVAYSGVCHTQLLECRGDRGDDPYLPHCLGHEGSGVVVEVSDQVTRCRPGQRVVLSWLKNSGADVPGTVYDWQGQHVNAGGITTFSTFTVVSENRVTPITGSLELRRAALLGCAVPTGAGAVMNTARVEVGMSVVVFGTGGVGLCAVATAALVGAAPIVAVDLYPNRLEIARSMGATLVIDAGEVDVVDQIKQQFPDGVDIAIEASGSTQAMQQALAVVRSRGGTAVVVGNAPHGGRVELDPWQLNQGKRLLGTWGGDCQADQDFPRLFQLVSEGKLCIDPLLSASYALPDINRAIEDLQSGATVRPLIDMNQAPRDGGCGD